VRQVRPVHLGRRIRPGSRNSLRSAASSPSVELTNTRSRRSGVRMTASSRCPWLTCRPR
jgi:hypothetical protein